MYPKLKANHEAGKYKQRSSCLNSNSFQSPASENNQEDDMQIYVAKIPKIYIPSVLISESESTTEMNKPIRVSDIEVKHKPKASPILRPRAVVSSPDNDAMIGNINKIEERKAKKVLKNGDHIKNRASQPKNVSTTNVKISHRIVAKQSGVSSK
ncbi:uncharacterized protein LOC17880684 isoform X2 [Capsella rubella]|nr:uncharacterized protein LOC17880684 isoform X2 [Capsella rubella]